MDPRTTHMSSIKNNKTKILILRRDFKVTMISSMLVKVVEAVLQYIPLLETATMK